MTLVPMEKISVMVQFDNHSGGDDCQFLLDK